MADKQVKILIVGDSASAQAAARAVNNAFSQTEKAAVSLGTRLQETGDRWQSTGRQLSLYVTAPLLLLAKKSIDTAEDFSKAMNTMAAVAGVPAPKLEKLKALAIDLGTKTALSANDAAKGMLELAKAGIRVSDILGGALKNTLDLAIAGDLELADASRVTANAMKVFELSGEQSQIAVDALAGAANQSSADLSDLAMALAQGSQAAHAAGLNIQETTAVLAAFADNGLRASDAGTSLKTFLLNLIPTSIRAKETMRDLGISFEDAHGNIVPVTEMAQILQDKLGGLTQAQQQAALKVMFGTDAFRAARIMMDEGAKGLEKYIDATSKSGAAAEVAKGKMEGLPGALERLRGAAETVLLTLGDRLAPTVIQVAGFLTELGDAFTSLPVPAQETIVKVLALIAAAGPLILILGKLMSTVGLLINSIQKLGTTTGQMKAGVAVAAVALIGFALSFERAEGAAEGLLTQLTSGGTSVEHFVSEMMGAAEASEHFGTQVSDAFKAVFTGAPTATQQWNSMVDALKEARAQTLEMGLAQGTIQDAYINAASAGMIYADIVARFGPEMAEASGAADQLAAAQRALTEAKRLDGIATAELVTEEESLLETRRRLAGLADDVTTAELNLKDSKRALADAMKVVNDLEAQGIDSGRKYKQAVDDVTRAEIALRDSKRHLNDTYQTLLENMEGAANKGRTNEAAFLKLADAMGIGGKKAKDLIKDFAEGSVRLQDLARDLGLTDRETATLNKAFELLSAKTHDSVNKVKDELSSIPPKIREQAPKVKSEAIDLGEQITLGLSLGIYAKKSTAVNAAIEVAWAAVQGAKRKLGIKSPSRVFMQIGNQIVEGLAQGITDRTNHVSDRLDRLMRKLLKWDEQVQKDVEKKIDRLGAQMEKALSADNLSDAEKQKIKDFYQDQIDALKEYGKEQGKIADRLEREGERLQNRLDKLKDRLRAFKDDIKSGFSGLSDFVSQFTGDTAPTVDAIRQMISERLGQAVSFASTLQKLVEGGASKALISQIASSGIDALPFANALLGDPTLAAELSDALQMISNIAEGTSDSLGQEFFGEEIDQAKADLAAFAAALRDATKAAQEGATSGQSSVTVNVNGEARTFTAADIANLLRRAEIVGGTGL